MMWKLFPAQKPMANARMRVLSVSFSLFSSPLIHIAYNIAVVRGIHPRSSSIHRMTDNGEEGTPPSSPYTASIENSRLFAAAASCQLSRAVAARLLQAHQLYLTSEGARGRDVSERIAGAFVRVMPAVGTQYRVGQVQGLVQGEPYHPHANVTTTLYIQLYYPNGNSRNHRTTTSSSLASSSASAAALEEDEDIFDLNAVSNSRMTEEEFRRWICEISPAPLPTVEELQHIASRIRHGAGHQGATPEQGKRRHNETAPRLSLPHHHPTHSPSSSFSSEPSTSFSGMPPMTSRIRVEQQQQQQQQPDSSPLSPQTVQECLRHLKQSYTVIRRPTPLATLEMLRDTEEALLDYMTTVQECIDQNKGLCCLCYLRLPTVVFYPCKHRMVCRRCACSLEACPFCRAELQALFEPKHIVAGSHSLATTPPATPSP